MISAELAFEQRTLRGTARRLLEQEMTPPLLSSMAAGEEEYPKALLARMAALGWFGLLVPNRYGGSGGSLVDALVLLEELGRVCAGGPYLSSAVVAARLLLAGATEEQKREYLPAVAEGRSLMTLALTEPSASFSAAALHASADEDRGRFRINGTKLFVPEAHLASHLLVVARTQRCPAARDGLSLFLVPSASPGVTINALNSAGVGRVSEVVLNDVMLPEEMLVGSRGTAWPVVEDTLAHAAVGAGALMLGGARAVLEMSVDYAAQRHQFGQSIGRFQAIQTLCADMAVDVFASDAIVYRAGSAIDDRSADRYVLAGAAKAWVSDAFVRVTHLAHRVHGAIGFSQDHRLHVYTKAAYAERAAYGDVNYHRRKLILERIARPEMRAYGGKP